MPSKADRSMLEPVFLAIEPFPPSPSRFTAGGGDVPGGDLVKPLASILLIAIALLLAACQEPPSTFTFEGATTAGGVEQPLTLTYEQRGNRLTGEYQIRAAKGAFRGTLDGNTVTAELTPSPTCTYAFEGALTDTTLTGNYEPISCIGGQAGTWALELK